MEALWRRACLKPRQADNRAGLSAPMVSVLTVPVRGPQGRTIAVLEAINTSAQKKYDAGNLLGSCVLTTACLQEKKRAPQLPDSVPQAAFNRCDSVTSVSSVAEY